MSNLVQSLSSPLPPCDGDRFCRPPSILLLVLVGVMDMDIGPSSPSSFARVPSILALLVLMGVMDMDIGSSPSSSLKILPSMAPPPPPCSYDDPRRAPPSRRPGDADDDTAPEDANKRKKRANEEREIVTILAILLRYINLGVSGEIYQDCFFLGLYQFIFSFFYFLVVSVRLCRGRGCGSFGLIL